MASQTDTQDPVLQQVVNTLYGAPPGTTRVPMEHGTQILDANGNPVALNPSSSLAASVAIPAAGTSLTGGGAISTPLIDWGGGIYNAKATQNPGGVYVGDGVANDGASINGAIQAAINAGGGRVLLPRGTPKFTAALTDLSVDGVTVEGDGWDTVLKPVGNFNVLRAISSVLSTFRRGIKVSNLMIDCAGLTGGNALTLSLTYEALVDWVRIINCPGTALFLTGPGGGGGVGAYTQVRNTFLETGQGAAAIGVNAIQHERSSFDGLHVFWYQTAGALGMLLQSGYNHVRANFDECDTAIEVYFNEGQEISGCNFDRGITRFLWLVGMRRSTINHNFFGTFVGTGSKNVMDVQDAQNASNKIGSNNMAAASGWTNWLVEQAGTGTPGNEYDNNETQGLGVTLVSGIMRKNRGYNPHGAGAVGGVTTGAYIYTNNQGEDQELYIYGGTVTTIVKDGATIASYGGAAANLRVALAPLEAVTINNTVVPTIIKDRR